MEKKIGTMVEEAELMIDLCGGEKSSGAISAIGARIGMICLASQQDAEKSDSTGSTEMPLGGIHRSKGGVGLKPITPRPKSPMGQGRL